MGADETRGPLPVAAVGDATRIAKELREAILGGAYNYQEKLPPERELAAHFNTSRSSVRAAMRQLEDMRLVDRRVGSGTFITYTGSVSEDTIAELVSPLELIEVREALEPRMASLAVLHATVRDIERLTEALRRVEAAVEAENFSQADLEFHRVVAECTHNKLIIWLYKHISDVRQHNMWSAMKDKILTPENIAKYNAQHRRLVEAITERNQELARKAVDEHLGTAERHLHSAGL